MTLDEAYGEVMRSVESLKAQGVSVSSEVPANLEGWVADPNIVNRGIAPEKWRHVSFYPADQIQSEMVATEHQRLLKMGIGFDSGGGAGLRDWEIDWSLRISPVRDLEQEDAVAEVNDLVDQIENYAPVQTIG